MEQLREEKRMMLSPTNRAAVARVVTGLQAKIENGEIKLFKESEDGDWKTISYLGYFDPDKHHRHWRMMVEWLFKKVEMTRNQSDAIKLSHSIIAEINAKDTAALEQLVFELMGKKDEA